jgi:putative glutamine amidotransferase
VSESDFSENPLGSGSPSTLKPRIGLNVDVAQEESGRIVTRMNIRYSDLILQHGGIPVIFPPGVNPDDVSELIDGFLLIGGDDYVCGMKDRESPPARFVGVLPRREEADLVWAHWLLQSDLPVLGICGGLQALVLASGGDLVEDIETEIESNVIHRVVEPGNIPKHEINWNGHLSECPPSGTFVINSSHHQSVGRLPVDWQLLAQSEDGVVEACADESGRCVGVQWHPELMPDDVLGHAITRRLILRAMERQGSSSCRG